jgi:hypothetical protein
MQQQNRNQYREIFFTVWKKMQQQQAIDDAMETLIAQVIKQHPEYHHALSDYDKTIDKDYTPEMGDSNPFLHMSMHIGIAEQLMVDQPQGIKSLYQQLCSKLKDSHGVEHLIMECLGNIMWQSQQSNSMPDMDEYLRCVKKSI